MRHLAVVGVSIALFASNARADWMQASSDHFVIYGDQSEKEIGGFAERLERFNSAMSYLFGKSQEPKPSPSNRVTIFVVSNQTAVREVAGTANRYLAGFYLPRAGATVAVIPERLSGGDMKGESVLYHEYAHHFMVGLSSRTFPRWFVEGFAEFFGSVRFDSDGSIKLGIPTRARAEELAYARPVPIRRLLDFDGGASEPTSSYESFYGQSWLLFHYLQMEPERAGQLVKYQQLLASGATALEAAERAFGDLDKLEQDLESYQRRRRVNVLVIDSKKLGVGPIAVRRLRAGEAAMMPIMIESKVGVTREEALQLLPKARKVAAEYPDDPAVLEALAEAEVDAGYYAAAIAAADRAVALDANRINAIIQKGQALYRETATGVLPKESWKDVRGQFVAANKVEHDNPIPLVQFYLTYLEQGVRPTENAVAGLEWALQLAPYDTSLRWLVAQQMIGDGRLDEAVQTLALLAYSPHPGEQTEKARKLLQQVEESRAAKAAAPEPVKPD